MCLLIDNLLFTVKVLFYGELDHVFGQPGPVTIVSIPNVWFLSQWNTLSDTVVDCGIEMSTCTHYTLFSDTKSSESLYNR